MLSVNSGRRKESLWLVCQVYGLWIAYRYFIIWIYSAFGSQISISILCVLWRIEFHSHTVVEISFYCVCPPGANILKLCARELYYASFSVKNNMYTTCAHVRKSYARPRKCARWMQDALLISNTVMDFIQAKRRWNEKKKLGTGTRCTVYWKLLQATGIWALLCQSVPCTDSSWNKTHLCKSRCQVDLSASSIWP